MARFGILFKEGEELKVPVDLPEAWSVNRTSISDRKAPQVQDRSCSHSILALTSTCSTCNPSSIRSMAFDAPAAFLPNVAGEDTLVLILFENSNQMQPIWPDLRDHHLPALLQAARERNPAGSCHVSWLTSSSYLNDSPLGDPHTSTAEPKEYPNLNIPFDHRPQNRITVGAALDAIQLLSTQKNSSRHLVIIAASEPFPAPETSVVGSSGFWSPESQTWTDVAYALAANGVHCHVILNADSIVNTFTTLFTDTMRQQGNVEEPRTFGSDSVLLRLSARRPMDTQAFPGVMQDMNEHPLASSPYEPFYITNTSSPPRPPPMPRANTFPPSSIEIYPNSKLDTKNVYEGSYSSIMENIYPLTTHNLTDIGLLGELMPTTSNGNGAGMDMDYPSPPFSDQCTSSEYSPLISSSECPAPNGYPSPGDEFTFAPYPPSPSIHYVPSSSSSSDSPSPINLVDHLQQHFDLSKRSNPRKQPRAPFIRDSSTEPRQRARIMPSQFRRPAELALSPLITTPATKPKLKSRRAGPKGSIAGSSPRGTRHPLPHLIRTARRTSQQASAPASPLDGSPITPHFDRSIKSNHSSVASSPVTPYGEEIPYADVPLLSTSASPLTPLCSGTAFSDTVWPNDGSAHVPHGLSGLSQSFSRTDVSERRNQYPISQSQTSSNFSDMPRLPPSSRRPSPVRVSPVRNQAGQELFVMNLAPEKTSSFQEEMAHLEERTGYTKLEPSLPPIEPWTTIEPIPAGIISPSTAMAAYPSAPIPNMRRNRDFTQGAPVSAFVVAPYRATFSPHAPEFPTPSRTKTAFMQQQHQCRPRANSSSLQGWAG